MSDYEKEHCDIEFSRWWNSLSEPEKYGRLDVFTAGYEASHARREKEVAELKRQIEIKDSRASQFESTVMATVENRDFLKALVRELVGALEYYAHPDHYESCETLGGTRDPGVLVELGRKARFALAKVPAELIKPTEEGL